MSASVTLDTVVIGGGVVGLAVLRALAQAGRDVTLLEAEPRLGSHTSSRNSEVIHAGIYYPEGSLKARLCLRGKQLLYDFCEREGVPHRRVGKLIVATNDEERSALAAIHQSAERCGVGDLVPLDGSQVRELERDVRACAGLLSPSTGIVDSHALMSALRRDAEAAGAQVVVASPVLGGRVLENGFELRVGGVEPSLVRCRGLVNSAGLFSQRFARSLKGLPESSIPRQFLAKGHYYTLSGRSPFQRLVYPVPVPGGLGVHVTLDLAGQARFGPDVTWVDEVDYGFDESRTQDFYTAIRRYFPTLTDGALVPGYTGIRPKLVAAGAPAADFMVQGPSEHGVAGLVNLFGIESPGLTASLALAELVVEKLAPT